MAERQSDMRDRVLRARRTPGRARRAADRYSAAVVAEEIRRLQRYWRPNGLRTGSALRRSGENQRPTAAF